MAKILFIQIHFPVIVRGCGLLRLATVVGSTLLYLTI
jgi:hypothetical protein